MRTKQVSSAVSAPPPWVLGATMLFWGLMTGRLGLGMILAIFVEAKRWVRFEWEFDDQACTRAWQFSCMAIGLVAVLVWLDGNRYEALPVLLSWLPPLLMPMHFVQTYGGRESIPLNTFSFLAQQRRNRNRRLGLPSAIYFVHFGNVLFVTTLVSATVGSFARGNVWVYLGGIILLTGWVFVVKNRSGIMALGLAFAVVVCIAKLGQAGLSRVSEWATSYGEGGERKFDPNNVDTLIGKPGRVQQSFDIIWRVSPGEGSRVPRLLRLASYGIYGNGTWSTDRVSALDFQDLDTLELTRGNVYYTFQKKAEQTDVAKKKADQAAISPTLPRFRLRGAAAAETPLPLPGNAASLREFGVDAIEANSFGSVRIFPKASVIDGEVLWGVENNPETAPSIAADLLVPDRERTVVSATARAIGLVDEPDFEKRLELLRRWFRANFNYSKQLKIYSSTAVVSQPTGISKFLTTQREGHCEYFATAATLLLREVGIPARYTTGYMVSEKNPKRRELVIRGTHGHAWCRAWNEASGTWVDLDATPPQWLLSASPAMTRTQRFNDAVKKFREDFFLWRNRPSNRLASSVVMSAIGLGVAFFVGRRLWKSRKRVEQMKVFNEADGPRLRTPLHDLEPYVRKHLGYRPAGETFAVWLKRLHPSLVDSAVLDEAIELHQRLRFDPLERSPEDRMKLSELSEVLGRGLR